MCRLAASALSRSMINQSTAVAIGWARPAEWTPGSLTLPRLSRVVTDALSESSCCSRANAPQGCVSVQSPPIPVMTGRVEQHIWYLLSSNEHLSLASGSSTLGQTGPFCRCSPLDPLGLTGSVSTQVSLCCSTASGSGTKQACCVLQCCRDASRSCACSCPVAGMLR